MLGIILLVVFCAIIGGFLCINYVAIRLGMKHASRRTNDQRKIWLGGLAGFVLVTGLPAAYALTERALLQHRYTTLCETRGGITVYVTPEEYGEIVSQPGYEKLPRADTFIESITDYYKLKDDWVIDGMLYEDNSYVSKEEGGIYYINGRGAGYDDYSDRWFYSTLLVDIKLDKPLAMLVKPPSGGNPAHFFDFTFSSNYLVNGKLSGFKFWESNLKGCYTPPEPFDTLAEEYAAYTSNKEAT